MPVVDAVVAERLAELLPEGRPPVPVVLGMDANQVHDLLELLQSQDGRTWLLARYDLPKEETWVLVQWVKSYLVVARKGRDWDSSAATCESLHRRMHPKLRG